VRQDDRDAQERRDFRAWVRAHHPDAGGDSEAFVAGLTAWRRCRTQRGQQARSVPVARPEVTVFRTRHGMWRLTRWWRRHHGTRRVR
jgi:hypothetical protein